jgi:protein TonB
MWLSSRVRHRNRLPVVHAIAHPIVMKIIVDTKPPPPPHEYATAPAGCATLSGGAPVHPDPGDHPAATPAPNRHLGRHERETETSAAPAVPPHVTPEALTPKPPAPPPPVAAPPPGPIATARPEPVRVPPVIDAAKNCKKPAYPPASVRLGEKGTVLLRFLIDTDGRVKSSEVQSSSGHQRLDEAAREALSLCRFKPGISDGQPVEAWATLRYTWVLQE